MRHFLHEKGKFCTLKCEQREANNVLWKCSISDTLNHSVSLLCTIKKLMNHRRIERMNKWKKKELVRWKIYSQKTCIYRMEKREEKKIKEWIEFYIKKERNLPKKKKKKKKKSILNGKVKWNNLKIFRMMERWMKKLIQFFFFSLSLPQ